MEDKGRRICMTHDCDHPATWAVMWTDGWQYHCEYHCEGVVGLGNIMGFAAASQSARKMTMYEMYPDVHMNAIWVQYESLAQIARGNTLKLDREDIVRGLSALPNLETIQKLHALEIAMWTLIKQEKDLARKQAPEQDDDQS